MSGPRLDAPHFESKPVEVRWEWLTLTDGREFGEVAVAETHEGTVTRWPGTTGSYESAWLSALSAALAGEYDAVDYRDIVLRHDEDSHIEGGVVRAVSDHGSKTVWASKEGLEEADIWRALEPALAGEYDAGREVEA